MKKSELFARILAVVSDVTEIPAELILSRNTTEEVVDARFLLVHFLYYKGFYPSQIARMVQRTPRQVSSLIHSFEARKCRGGGIIEANWNFIKKSLRNSLEISNSLTDKCL